jgi:ribosomal protein L20
MSRVKRGVTAHSRHLKVIKAAKGSRGRQKIPFVRLFKELKKVVNMHIGTEKLKNALLEVYGYKGLMLLQES